MGYLLTIGCYLVAFSPAFALFCRFVAPDPLRTILFVLGAFLWLIAFLISSLLWLIFSLFWVNLPFIVGISVLLQEGVKIGYFVILKKAQHGLNKMAKNGAGVVGISDLHNARHMLALVCGLGMGVISALFLTMNIFATFSGPASRGLPEALRSNSHDVNPAGALLPLYYALSGQVISLLHVTWTIMIWDTCHHFGNGFTAYLPATVAFGSHLLVSGISLLNQSGYQHFVLPAQFFLLFVSILYSHIIIGGTFQSLGQGITSAFSDWFTLAWLRSCCKRRNEYQVEELEAEERNVVAQ